MLADNSMDREALDVHEVKGLGIANSMTDKGYVVFCSSRLRNRAFFRWFVINILIPHTRSIRNYFDLPADAMAWFQLDGEPIQMECFQDPEILDLVHANHSCVGKPAGSTTEITQACDAGAVFKGPKTTNKRINDADVVSNSVMINRLKEVFRNHDAAVTHDTDKKMSHNINKNAIMDLLRVQMALRLSLRADITVLRLGIPLNLPETYTSPASRPNSAYFSTFEDPKSRKSTRVCTLSLANLNLPYTTKMSTPTATFSSEILLKNWSLPQ